MLKPTRRRWLEQVASVGAGFGLFAWPNWVKARPKPPVDALDPAVFRIHSKSPITAETRRTQVGFDWITPTERLFVRNNLPLPDPAIVSDPNAWTLELCGAGARTHHVSVSELKGLTPATAAMVVQCSGNGRKFFPHGASGSPWGTGAAGNVVVHGVRLQTLVSELGLALEGARYATALGGDPLPAGLPEDTVQVERSVPLDDALERGMLVWEMNGAPLSLLHGGPLRFVVPGYYGCNQIKYVKRLRFTETESPAKIQQTGYRLRKVGAKGQPNQPSMRRMNVKSWIVSHAPGTAVRPGVHRFFGVAFSGAGAVASVDYSLDGGKVWQVAQFLGDNLGPYAWRVFAFSVELGLGAVEVLTRATDRTGAVQPMDRFENERGYGNNSVRDHGVALEVSSHANLHAPREVVEAPRRTGVPLSKAAERGRALFLRGTAPPCGTCHALSAAGTEGKVGPSLDALVRTQAQIRSAIQNGVGAMPPMGAQLGEAELRDLAAFVHEAGGAR